MPERFVHAAIAAAFLTLSAAVAAAPKAPPAAKAPPAPVPIALSHQLDEERAERVEKLIDQFNGQQSEVRVALVRRKPGDAPSQINLVTRAEYARMTDSRARFTPLAEVMRDARERFDASQLSPELRATLTDSRGQLIALPLAYSTPVLFINKEMFRKAGLDPANPPKTWFDAQQAAGKLAQSGVSCPFTTSRPTWVMIDNVSAWDGAPVTDDKGMPAFNGLVQVKHIAMLATWHKSKYFIYFGRRNEADDRFAHGECGMLASDSALYARLVDDKRVDVGVSPLPYHDDVYGAPQHTLADGASLWAGAGLKPAEAKAVARFVKYVLGPEIQINLTLAGGYLPMTPVARAAASSKLLAADLAGLEVAYSQLRGKLASPPLRIGQNEGLRNIVDEELEAVWADRKPAKQALDEAVMRAVAHLRSHPSAGGKARP